MRFVVYIVKSCQNASGPTIYFGDIKRSTTTTKTTTTTTTSCALRTPWGDDSSPQLRSVSETMDFSSQNNNLSPGHTAVRACAEISVLFLWMHRNNSMCIFILCCCNQVCPVLFTVHRSVSEMVGQFHLNARGATFPPPLKIRFLFLYRPLDNQNI